MQAMFISLLSDNWHIWVLGSFVLCLFSWFLYGFVIKNYQLRHRFSRSIAALEMLQKDKSAITLDDIEKNVMGSDKLQHLWSEFADTLHPQSEIDEYGQERVVRWRQTVPAEAYFNIEALVAVELKTEYFKHQPGIFTGLGIIGTFLGLLKGLTTFNISSDPEAVRASLETLIHGVLEAFLVSAVAIGLAMLTTFVEKLAIAGRIQQVEKFCNLLDSLFDSGAGEEYLSRLVTASENSATQAAQLKDAFIADLKSLLNEITHQQSQTIANSFQKSSEASGDRIANAIAEVLSDPIQKIAAAVQTTSDTNGQVVTRALNEALVAFSQKLEDMFGSQMTNMNQLLMETTKSMQATVGRFDELASNIDNAGKNAADAMAERLTQALESMEQRQDMLNRTMSDFVAQLRDMVQSSQTETNQRLQDAFSLMSEKLAAIASQMEEQARTASSSHQAQQQRLAENADKTIHDLADTVEKTVGNLDAKLSGFVGMLSQQIDNTSFAQKTVQHEITEHVRVAVEQLSQQVQALVDETNRSVSTMQGTVAAMREITHDASRRMESSADTLAVAANDFAKAGSSVSDVINQASQVGDKLSTTAAALSSAAAVVNTALTDYQSARDAITRMVSELKIVVDAAKQDASVSQNLVNQIARTAELLSTAHSDVEGLFEGVCNELAKTHQAFAKNVEDTLKKSNGAFQKELKDAVVYLKTAVEELGEVADSIPTRR